MEDLEPLPLANCPRHITKEVEFMNEDEMMKNQQSESVEKKLDLSEFHDVMNLSSLMPRNEVRH